MVFAQKVCDEYERKINILLLYYQYTNNTNNVLFSNELEVVIDRKIMKGYSLSVIYKILISIFFQD